MAEQIGIPIIFDLTVGAIASSRTMEDIQQIIGSRQLACNIDQAAVG
jgi:hypothetical protein